MCRIVIAICCLTTCLLESARAQAPQKPIQKSVPAKIFIDLQPLANRPISDEMHDSGYRDDTLVELPQGRSDFGGGVEFRVGPKCIAVNGKLAPDRPVRVDGIKVGAKFARLQILHACGWGAFGGKANPIGHYQEDGTFIGYYRVNYADGDWELIPIFYGRDVRDWWGIWDNFKPTTHSKVIWRGSNDHLRQRSEAKGIEFPLRLFLTEWKNPRPNAVVTSIDMVSEREVAAPFCVAMTALPPGAAGSSNSTNQEEIGDLKREIIQLRNRIEQLEQASAPKVPRGFPQPLVAPAK